MMRRVFFASLLIVSFLTLAHPAPVAAMPSPLRQVAVCSGTFANFLGLEPWYQCVQDASGKLVIDNLNDFWLIGLTIVDDAVKLGVYIATGFVIWGGFKYLKSQGDSSQISQAKDVIRNALIGLVITLLAVAIVQFIAQGIK